MAKKKKKSEKSGSKKQKSRKLKKREKLELRAEADGLGDTQAKAAPAAPSMAAAPAETPVRQHVDKPLVRKAVELDPPQQPVNRKFVSDAAKVLGAAAAIAVMMMLAAVLMPEGSKAIKGIGGFVSGTVPEHVARLALVLDTLFPVFYGAGLVIFTASLQTRGNRPLVRLILTALIVVVAADFAENAMAFAAMTGFEPNKFQWPLTVLKYAGVAFISVLISSIIVPYDRVSQIVRFAARYVLPIGVAILISGFGGDTMRSALAVLFPVSLLLLAQLAHNMGRR